ncbi:MAG: hypothetical protein LBT19_03455 [Candidatus Nomurabacteria bacterium]|nr:hypothetical protein [Candidatus Nomurabacteria bacterium]
MNTSKVDVKSLENTKSLFETGDINTIEIGTTKLPKQIPLFLFTRFFIGNFYQN